MKKAASRRIPYRVYKKMFSDCFTRDYDGHSKSIVVDFPDEYLSSRAYVPDGWELVKGAGGRLERHYGRIFAEIISRTDGGCKHYDACLQRGNSVDPFGSYTEKDRDYFRSIESAVAWCDNTAQVM